ncbi:hypothetical protein [Marinoscillum sp.]|uniref:hypothetical protein n=1 Tax=Marinoscillum sp. TaxID=2024838 RepID=UPI003BAC8554
MRLLLKNLTTNYLDLIAVKTFLFTALVTLLLSCSSDKEVSPDCTESDLAIQLSETVNVDCSSAGSIEVTATGGAGNYSFSIDGVNFQAMNTFDGLSAGSYTISVKDNNECIATISATISAQLGNVSTTVEQLSVSGCDSSNGAVMLTASGGVGAYQYAVDGKSLTDQNTFDGLESGAHTYLVQDEEGCTDEGDFKVLSGVSLETDIMPIIMENCATNSSCHGAGASGKPVFETKTAIISNAGRIKIRTSARTMPPPEEDPLSNEQIARISCWVDDEAPNN